MKKRIGLLLAILLTATALPLSVFAMDDMSTTTTNADTSSSEEFAIEENDQSAEYKAKLEERMAKRRSAIKKKLTTVQQNRLKTKCKAAQGLIAKLSATTKSTKTSRDEIYANITKHATKLRDRLKENGQDTTKLDTNLTELNALVLTFKADLQELRQAAADVNSIDCTTDVTGFKAAVETLQTARDKVAQDSQAIRTYIKDKLKPTLQEIHNSIGETKKEESN